MITCLKTAWAYLWHHKFFTAINVAGLAIGLCVFYFAFLYIHFELSYDSFNKNEAHIYRLVTDVQTPTATEYQSSSAPMAPALQAIFPQIKAATRIFLDNLIIEKDENNFNDETIAYADASLFKVFTLPLLRGNPETVLEAPYTIVLSSAAAKKYFGNENAVGKTLWLDGKFPAAVTGIMQDMPYNSQWRADILVSMSTLLKEWNKNAAVNWQHFGFYTYLLLRDGYNAGELSKQLPAFVNNHFPQTQAKYLLHLEPLKSVYLHGKPRGSRTGTAAHGNAANVYIFSLVALFILVLASINFINLTTALSLRRAKETSIRKVLGASRQQLVLQFIADAVLIAG
ncbi:MAG TPA: ABC transporter permease, partial [Chitinophagaceae bacterium]|nr:ABC transporter permease [Chitinophagaceae bacterium]